MAEPKNLSISPAELQAMLDRAAETGSKRSLDAIGLHDEDAAADVRDLRGLLESWRSAKRTALQTGVSFITKAVLVAMLVGLGWRTFMKE